MSSSNSSAKRRFLRNDEKENDHIENSNGGVKKPKIMSDDRIKIREQIVEEFRNRNLKVPVQMLDLIDGFPTSKTNRSDVEHRKELYTHLSSYLDRRQVRNRGQAYIFPQLINDMIRCRFPNDIRSYDTGKTVKNGKLHTVAEENKHYVQWQDFCKEID